MAKWTKTEIEEARATLREWLKPGTTVWTSVKTVARSGMSRTISVYLIEGDEPRWISRLVAKALNQPFDERTEAVRIGGCGMDMGFHLVNSLSYALHGMEKHGECPPLPHERSQCVMTNDPTPEHYHAGYSLKQRWL